MALNLKKGQIITILDVLLIAFVMFFAKSYLNKYNKNSTSVTKDGVKYTLVINNQKIVKDELMNIRFKIENKKKDKKILEIKKAVPFNYIIEKDGKFIYKRDLEERITNPKKIFLGKYGKTEFGSEWYGNNVQNEKIIPGNYRIIAYNTDLNVELILNFEIVEDK
ncbi:MAG: hypothetical protein KA277_06730 [Fusobacteriaceae bacterium]|jgi:hypothetical protein|nr:hypothetical protein [Fusobacteriaceae bacterium]MBP6467702.1 hypothetical protein [Fusobacteriaceae bacterium]MBP9595286.1 hypothetical protein [Fusobacteriaceae bacterium]MBU9917445.1 hypothetical protein [Fusobacteriaceae bacterium]